MADKFDPYREALVIETETVFPEELGEIDPAQQATIAQRLHAEPEQAADLEYVRQHTGFRRKIVVTADDVQRLG